MAWNDENIRPASEDPLGDPADQEGLGRDILPASQDPYGDPADQAGLQDALSQHLGNTDASYTEQQVSGQVAGMPPSQANDLASTLLGMVQQQGVDINGLASRYGIDLSQAGQYLPQLMGLLHQNHPDELAQAAAQQPDLAGLLAHPSAGGILGALASRFLSGR
jgi:hypothetical protein